MASGGVTASGGSTGSGGTSSGGSTGSGGDLGSGGSDASYANTLQQFRNNFGTTGEYNTITQYYGEDASSGYGNISLTNLGSGTADWFDSSAPPTNVTDSAVQGEVQRYLGSHAFDNSTRRGIYIVFGAQFAW